MNRTHVSPRWLAVACAVFVPSLAGVAAPGSASATAASAPCFDVAQFLGGAGHDGSGMPTTGIVGAPSVLWVTPTSGPMNAAPAIADGVAYFGDGILGSGGLRAVDVADGTDLWNVSLPGQPWGSTPAVDDGVVYVADSAGNVTAVDLDSRETIWTVSLAESISSSPAVSNGVVVINADDTVYVLDQQSGETNWTFANGGGGGYTLESSAAIVDGVILTTSLADDGDASMWALDVGTGEELWSYEPSEPGLFSPAYRDGVIYAGGPGGLVAVDAVTGEEIWSSPVGQVFSAPTTDGDVLVVHTRSDLVAVDPATGDVLWRADTGGGWSAPTLVDGVVYVGSAGLAFQMGVRLIDAETGSEIAHIKDHGPVHSPVVVTGGAAYAASSDGLVAVGVPGTATCAAPPA